MQDDEAVANDRWKSLAKHCRDLISELQRVARILRDKGLYKEAIHSFEVIVDGDETFDDGYYAYEIGICYEKMGDHESAKTYFELAAKNDPGREQFKEALERMKVVLPPFS